MIRLWALSRPVFPCSVSTALRVGARFYRPDGRQPSFLTLAIETSCDDTCVALLRTFGSQALSLQNHKISCATDRYGGIHPVEAVKSHTRNLAPLVQQTLQSLRPGQRPDLIAVTRGPGMTSCLSVGISCAKALSVALNVPLVAVHHMQAHTLTAHLEAAQRTDLDEGSRGPQYPFLTLLVSGGHTMLVYTKSSTKHRVLASTQRGIPDPREKGSPTAVGEMLDKCARAILPKGYTPTDQNVVYGSLLENFCYGSKYSQKMFSYEAPQEHHDAALVYQSENGWSIPPPLRMSQEMIYNFSGLGGKVRDIMRERPEMPAYERAELGIQTMRLAFEHVMSRVIMALRNDEELLANPPQSLVISGGVASNSFLRKIVASMLQARGFGDIKVITPKARLCTDNALMIAWTGMQMYKAGWTTDLSFLPQGEWPIEEILTGVDCWVRKDKFANVTDSRQDTLRTSKSSQPNASPLPNMSNTHDEPDASNPPTLEAAERSERQAVPIITLAEQLSDLQRRLKNLMEAALRADDNSATDSPLSPKAAAGTHDSEATHEPANPLGDLLEAERELLKPTNPRQHEPAGHQGAGLGLDFGFDRQPDIDERRTSNLPMRRGQPSHDDRRVGKPLRFSSQKRLNIDKQEASKSPSHEYFRRLDLRETGASNPIMLREQPGTDDRRVENPLLADLLEHAPPSPSRLPWDPELRRNYGPPPQRQIGGARPRRRRRQEAENPRQDFGRKPKDEKSKDDQLKAWKAKDDELKAWKAKAGKSKAGHQGMETVERESRSLDKLLRSDPGTPALLSSLSNTFRKWVGIS